MIVKLSRSGSSFKGLTTYLTHDPKANTTERVAWTHTLNCANEDLASAINEMYLTAQNAELLKHDSGVRAGGRVTEKPVKNVSLNWDPRDNPSQDHMLKTAEHFLKTMNWDEHQAILVAHSDKSYKHVHIVLNAIQPETGRHLNEKYDKLRAGSWAHEYEQAQGIIRCEQRALNLEEREKNMPRNMWVAFQQNEKEFVRTEKILAEKSPEIPETIQNAEWKILKEFQRDERIGFFAQGKIEYSELKNSIYREIRDEFSGRWADYYQARKSRVDPELLSAKKAEIVGDQKSLFDERRTEAFRELKLSRDFTYRSLLDRQKEERAELHWHQNAGIDAAPFLSALADRKAAERENSIQFRDAAREATGQDNSWSAFGKAFDNRNGDRGSGMRIKPLGFGSLLNSLFIDLTGEGPRPPEPDRDPYEVAAEEATKRQQSVEYRSWDHERLARQKSIEGD